MQRWMFLRSRGVVRAHYSDGALHHLYRITSRGCACVVEVSLLKSIDRFCYFFALELLSDDILYGSLSYFLISVTMLGLNLNEGLLFMIAQKFLAGTNLAILQTCS